MWKKRTPRDSRARPDAHCVSHPLFLIPNRFFQPILVRRAANRNRGFILDPQTSMAYTSVQHAGGQAMEEYRKVATLENEIEAQLLVSILKERDIPHMMRSYHDTAYDGLYQTQKGWGIVSAPETFEAEILEILEDMRKEADASTNEDIGA
jgi:hypothetical protein